MSKKLIIMIASAGLLSFAGAFAFAWLTDKTAPQNQSGRLNPPILAGPEAEPELPHPGAGTISAAGVVDSKMKRAMTEKQLKNLVYEVREKMGEYEDKLRGLEVREQRLQRAHNMVKKDIEELNNLQIELASTVASLKEQQDKLFKSRVKIAKTERDNLITLAATYDKMDAAKAGEILANMSQMQSGKVEGEGSSLDDVVEILHYMTERTRGKLLAELVTSKPRLAAVLCRELKRIVEEE